MDEPEIMFDQEYAGTKYRFFCGYFEGRWILYVSPLDEFGYTYDELAEAKCFRSLTALEKYAYRNAESVIKDVYGI